MCCPNLALCHFHPREWAGNPNPNLCGGCAGCAERSGVSEPYSATGLSCRQRQLNLASLQGCVSRALHNAAMVLFLPPWISIPVNGYSTRVLHPALILFGRRGSIEGRRTSSQRVGSIVLLVVRSASIARRILASWICAGILHRRRKTAIELGGGGAGGKCTGSLTCHGSLGQLPTYVNAQKHVNATNPRTQE